MAQHGRADASLVTSEAEVKRDAAMTPVRDFHKFLFKVQELQREAHEMGFHLTARVLNQAQNTAGWELAGEPETASAKLREEFGK
jgi:hypothetical protein